MGAKEAILTFAGALAGGLTDHLFDKQIADPAQRVKIEGGVGAGTMVAGIIAGAKSPAVGAILVPLGAVTITQAIRTQMNLDQIRRIKAMQGSPAYTPTPVTETVTLSPPATEETTSPSTEETASVPAKIVLGG